MLFSKFSLLESHNSKIVLKIKYVKLKFIGSDRFNEYEKKRKRKSRLILETKSKFLYLPELMENF